jgi:uncharacterized spore protein YtfJ
MEPTDVLPTLRDSLTVRTVFGEPITQDGLTVIPVARVGGGAGDSRPGEADGAHTGVGGTTTYLRAKPVGVFVIKDGKVSWRPALDLNKVILGGQLVAITALLTVRAIVQARRRG